MAAPGGILHKVQLHFEKCIQFTAVSALSFSPVFPRSMKKKKKKHSRNIFVPPPPPPFASVVMLGGCRRSFWGPRSHDLSLLKHHKRVSFNSVHTLSGTFPLPFVTLAFALLLRRMSPETC